MKNWIIRNSIFDADQLNPELKVSPWSGHRQFAYDLTTFIQPDRIVELGTHYGCSLFSFLQAIKDFDLKTEMIAIDSWKGDSQAGFYGNEVWELVNKTVAVQFPEQDVHLVRKFFDDAISDVEDESVDILHIDGLHTYEAVSHDFSTWLKKLKQNGIILLHDIESELGYGTNRFWKDLCQNYPEHFSFCHSWGLGIVFPKGDYYYRIFKQENMNDKIQIYEYKAKYQLASIQLNDHKVMVEERDKEIKSMENMINEKDKVMKKMDYMIADRDNAIKSMENMINKKDGLINKLESEMNLKKQELENYICSFETQKKELIEKQISIEKDVNTIKKMDYMIADRDAAIRSMTTMIDERDAAIKSMTAMIDERDLRIKELQNLSEG